MPPRPTLRQERAAWAEERLLVGVDEAGRGPLAGPVVAAAVVFPPGMQRIRGIRDSKLLPLARREELALMIAPALAQRMGVTVKDPVRFLALLHHRIAASTRPRA